MAFSNRNQSTDLFYVIPFNAVAFVLTAEQGLLLANISNLFAHCSALYRCLDSFDSRPLSPIQAAVKRIIKIHNLASILIKTNGASGGQFGLWNNGVRCAAKLSVLSTPLQFYLTTERSIFSLLFSKHSPLFACQDQ